MRIEPHERESHLWQSIKGHLQERLEVLRSKNDKPQDEIDTALIRGQIKEIKNLLVLDTNQAHEAPGR